MCHKTSILNRDINYVHRMLHNNPKGNLKGKVPSLLAVVAVNVRIPHVSLGTACKGWCPSPLPLLLGEQREFSAHPSEDDFDPGTFSKGDFDPGTFSKYPNHKTTIMKHFKKKF